MIARCALVMSLSPTCSRGTLAALPVLLPALVLSSASVAAAPPRPTRAAQRKVIELNRRALVEVVGPRRSGTGVIVGAAGQVLTSVDHVGLHEAKVRREGKLLSARVLLASAELKVALLEIQPAGEFPAVPVRPRADLPEGMWLLGLSHSRRGQPLPLLSRVVRPAGERSAFLELSEPYAAGVPLFDLQGKLVALSVGNRKGRKGRALPVAAVKAQLEEKATP